MSYTVRRHERRVTSGRTTTVRQHERRGGDGAGSSPYVHDGDDIYEVHPDGSSERLEPPEWWGAPGAPDEDWWASDEATAGDPEDEEATSDLPESPDNDEPMSPGMARLLGADTPEGRERYERGRALRESGYAGPMDRDGYPVPEDEPAGHANPVLDRMRDDMRSWRSRPEPQPLPEAPMTPQMARLLGCDTPEGREKWDRLRAYRDAGYKGPLGPDNRIPDPDDPANHEPLSALAALGEI